MGWEEVPHSGGNNGFFERIADDEVSIIVTKIKNSRIWRINFAKINLPENTPTLMLKVDKIKQRIGFFKAPSPEGGRKVIGYGKKSRLVYVSCPKILGEVGFERGRYKIIKPKEPDENLFFFLRADRKTGSLIKEEPINTDTPKAK